MRAMRLAWGLLSALAGCVQYEHGSEGADAGGDPSSSSSSSSPSTPTSSGADETTGVAGTTGGGGIDGDCEIWEQDCPEGSKCMPVDSDADGIHDTSKCQPLVESPKQVNDDCHVEGSPASGVDDCDVRAICWGVNQANKGACVGMCMGSPDHATCPDGLQCDVSNGGNLILCVMPCDPLAPSCPEGKVCIPGGEEKIFLCDTDASGDKGAYGDECEYVNVCDNGLMCISGTAVPGCPGQACCSEFCDLTEESMCTGQGQVCESVYDSPEDAPPGLEDVGVCVSPM